MNRDKIGIIGYSYSAGHAVKVASLDRRIKAVVSINGLISGSWLMGLMISDRPSADALIWGDRERRRVGDGEVGYLPVYKTAETSGTVFLPTDDAAEFYQRLQKTEIANGGEWKNGVTTQSLLKIRGYDIMEDLKVLAPTSFLMIVDEAFVESGLPQKAFEAAGEGGEMVRELVTIEGGHFDALAPDRGLESVIEHSTSFLRRVFDGEAEERTVAP